MKIEFTIPLNSALTVSESNRSNEHWLKKSKRHNLQKLLMNAYMALNLDMRLIPCVLPCTITMTRIAPRQLDFVNLVSSFKWFQDSIADFMIPSRTEGTIRKGKNKGQACRIYGRADDDERMQWEFKQEKGEPKQYAIRITIESENTKI